MKFPTCENFVKTTEKLWIREIWEDLVPNFLEIINKYPFVKAIICNEEHVRFYWIRNQLEKN